jgi:hypothetical protein
VGLSLLQSQIVPKLADNGIYIASESSFYRVLKAEKELKHRQKSKPVKQVKKPRSLVATAPSQQKIGSGLWFMVVANHKSKT